MIGPNGQALEVDSPAMRTAAFAPGCRSGSSLGSVSRIGCGVCGSRPGRDRAPSRWLLRHDRKRRVLRTSPACLSPAPRRSLRDKTLPSRSKPDPARSREACNLYIPTRKFRSRANPSPCWKCLPESPRRQVVQAELGRDRAEAIGMVYTPAWLEGE